MSEEDARWLWKEDGPTKRWNKKFHRRYFVLKGKTCQFAAQRGGKALAIIDCTSLHGVTPPVWIRAKTPHCDVYLCCVSLVMSDRSIRVCAEREQDVEEWRRKMLCAAGLDKEGGRQADNANTNQSDDKASFAQSKTVLRFLTGSVPLFSGLQDWPQNSAAHARQRSIRRQGFGDMDSPEDAPLRGVSIFNTRLKSQRQEVHASTHQQFNLFNHSFIRKCM
jgi:hypothetical protein